MDSPPADNRELVALAFRSLEAGFARGGDEEASSVLQEAFARVVHPEDHANVMERIKLDEIPEEIKELPEALQQEVRERQQEAALLREKRVAALQIVPRYSHLLQGYRAYDTAMGSPRRLARYLGMSATTVVVGGVLGYLVEQGTGLPYATAVGIGLGVIAFFSMMLQTLGTSRQMTQVESAHAAALHKLQEELYDTFEAVDARQAPERHEDPTS